MKELAVGLWQRANTALTVANAVLSLDPDTAASRAYFAALYAVSHLVSEAGVQCRLSRTPHAWLEAEAKSAG